MLRIVLTSSTAAVALALSVSAVSAQAVRFQGGTIGEARGSAFAGPGGNGASGGGFFASKAGKN